MADNALTPVLKELDQATTQVGSRIERLVSKISTSMSQETVDEVKTGLMAQVTRLNGFAADPDNPVPPEPPAGAAPGKGGR